MKDGWGYDINMGSKGKWLKAQTTFTDVYRSTQGIHLQASTITLGREFQLGVALAGSFYRDWRAMGVCRIEYEEGWMTVSTLYMTDLTAYRWTVDGGMQIPITDKLSFGPTVNYGGTESLSYGKGKIKFTYKL